MSLRMRRLVHKQLTKVNRDNKWDMVDQRVISIKVLIIAEQRKRANNLAKRAKIHRPKPNAADNYIKYIIIFKTYMIL